MFAAQSARRSQERPEGRQSPLDRLFEKAFEGVEIGEGNSVPGAAMISPPVRIDSGSQDSGHSQQTDRGRERNQPREVRVDNYSPTYQLDTSRLEQQMQQDVRKLKQRINQLENSLRTR